MTEEASQQPVTAQQLLVYPARFYKVEGNPDSGAGNCATSHNAPAAA
jgi:hypothetical protein